MASLLERALSSALSNKKTSKDTGGNVSSGISSKTGSKSSTSTSSTKSLEQQMAANSAAWHQTSNPAERERLHQENLKLAKQLGLTYNAATGTYSKSGTSSGSTSTSSKTGTSSSGTKTSVSVPAATTTPTTTKTTVSVSPGTKATTVSPSAVAVRDTFESDNYKYKVQYDNATGVIRVYDPNTGHSATIDKNNYKIVDGKAYIAPNIAENVVKTISSGKYTLPGYGSTSTASGGTLGTTGTKTSTGTTTSTSTEVPGYEWEDYYKNQMAQLTQYQQQQAALYQQYYEQQQEQINDYLQQMNEYMSQLSDAGLAMLQQYEEQYQQAIQQIQQYLEADTEIPQSVQLALQVLDEQLTKNIQSINNELNARGVYNSSMAADRIQEATEAMGTEKAQILANWLDQQHEQMFQAAIQLANLQAQYASNYANLYSQAYMQPLTQAMSLASNAYTLQSNLASQQYQAQSALAQTGLTLANQIYETFVKGKQAEEQAQAEAAAKAQEVAIGLQKWSAEQQLKQQQLGLDVARLQETQRHNIASENISATRAANAASSTKLPSVSLLKYYDEKAAAESEAERQQDIKNLAVNYDLDLTTAAYKFTIMPRIYGNILHGS